MQIALHTRLRAGAESAYEAAHTEVPAELIDAIRSAGVTDWTIWRSGLDLFHVIDCDDYPALIAGLRDLQVNVLWQRRMAEFLEVTHDYSTDGADATLPAVWRLPTEAETP